MEGGDEGALRPAQLTPGTVTRTPDFESGAFDQLGHLSERLMSAHDVAELRPNIKRCINVGQRERDSHALLQNSSWKRGQNRSVWPSF